MKHLLTVLSFLFFLISINLAATNNLTQNNRTLKPLSSFESQSLPTKNPQVQQILSCNSSEKRVDSIKVSNGRDTTIYKFSYDQNGYAVLYIAYSIKNQKASFYQKGIYEYFDKGKIASESILNWEDTAWSNESRKEYTYYADGKLKSSTYINGQGNQWINSSRNTDTYNSAGQVATTIIEGWSSGSWVNKVKHENTYNSYNDPTNLNFYTWKNQAWVFSMQMTSTYDSKRNMILNNTYTFLSDTVVEILRDSMAYNSSNYLIYQDIAIITGSQFNYMERYTFDYDSKGNNICQLEELRSGDNWVVGNRQTKKYDANNLPTEIINSSWQDNQWVDLTKITSTYNSKGKLTNEIYITFGNNAWSTVYNDVYKYDSSDTLLINFHVVNWNDDGSSVGAWSLRLNIDNNWLDAFLISGVDADIVYTLVTTPVELTSFTATYKNNAVQLKWQTSSETNNKGFSVEKKTASSEWTSIGFVDGAGTVTTIKNYIFSDNDALSGNIYYRLKQTDFDGTYKYSSEVTVNTDAPHLFALEQNYPNPFNPSTVISYSIPNDGNVKVLVYNTTGQLVKELANGMQTAGIHKIKFDASTLSSGIYFYTVESNGNRLIKKMALIK